MHTSEINGVLNIKEYVVDNIYKSKKNRVYSIYHPKKNLGYVIKEYSFAEGKSKDIFYLKLLKSHRLKVPSVLYEGKSFIIMEKIEGDTLLDIILEYERLDISPNSDEVVKLLNQVVKWLHDLYKILKKKTGKSLIFMDTNFRNFVVSDKIYGVDFEDIIEGEPIEDMGRLCAYLLLYYPENSPWKQSACNVLEGILIESYGYDSIELQNQIAIQLEIIENRRQLRSSV